MRPSFDAENVAGLWHSVARFQCHTHSQLPKGKNLKKQCATFLKLVFLRKNASCVAARLRSKVIAMSDSYSVVDGRWDSSQVIMPHTPMDMNEEGRNMLELAALLPFLNFWVVTSKERASASGIASASNI